VPALPAPLKNKSYTGDIFGAIRRQDILLHHPYDSFKPVVDFLRAGANDPDVLAIKQTLYRVGRNSPVVEALLDASQNSKQVAVLVELKRASTKRATSAGRADWRPKACMWYTVCPA
jgi:polyphosphate kinase